MSKVGRVHFKTEGVITLRGGKYFHLYRRGLFFWKYLATFKNPRDAWNMVDEILLGEGKRVIMYEHTRLVRDGLKTLEEKHEVGLKDI